MESQLELVSEIKKLNKAITHLYRQQSIMYSFVRGVMSGLGSVLGASLVVAFIAYLLRNVNLVPIVGDWLSAVFTQVINNLPSN